MDYEYDIIGVEPSYRFIRILSECIKKIFGCKFAVYYRNNIKDFTHEFLLRTEDGMTLEVSVEHCYAVFNLDLISVLCNEFVSLYKEVYGGKGSH